MATDCGGDREREVNEGDVESAGDRDHLAGRFLAPALDLGQALVETPALATISPTIDRRS